jgi:nitrogen regulatory protein P-II 1
VNDIVSAIQKAAFTGQIGDGKIFIHPLEDAVRVRTAERGIAAIR